MNIFISYSSANKKIVDRIAAVLSANGYDVWIDTKALIPGLDWWPQILQGIQKCDIFLFMVSKTSCISAYCRAEINFAYLLNRLIIPVVLPGHWSGHAKSYYNFKITYKDINYLLETKLILENLYDQLISDKIITGEHINNPDAVIESFNPTIILPAEIAPNGSRDVNSGDSVFQNDNNQILFYSGEPELLDVIKWNADSVQANPRELRSVINLPQRPGTSVDKMYKEAMLQAATLDVNSTTRDVDIQRVMTTLRSLENNALEFRETVEDWIRILDDYRGLSRRIVSTMPPPLLRSFRNAWENYEASFDTEVGKYAGYDLYDPYQYKKTYITQD